MSIIWNAVLPDNELFSAHLIIVHINLISMRTHIIRPRSHSIRVYKIQLVRSLTEETAPNNKLENCILC